MSGGTSWSLASIYGTSLTFQNSGDHAELGLPASGWDDSNFSINFWFRRTEESFTWSSQQMSNVMLSLANEENCSIQIGTKGPSVEVYLASVGKTSRTTINANVQDGTGTMSVYRTILRILPVMNWKFIWMEISLVQPVFMLERN